MGLSFMFLGQFLCHVSRFCILSGLSTGTMNALILEYLNLEDNLGLEFDLDDVSSLVEANALARPNFRPQCSFLNSVRLELNVGYGGRNMLSLLLEISNNLKVLALAKVSRFYYEHMSN
ncbi:hypothetical protein V6N12_046891 [Hibiscus sabdariffa]|uniref:FBD domain-containing protein n=1 Tax=Hibiscus sabdariffa TaxID=183260 RepID=A0ABR2BCR2_9ROSI